MLNYRLKIGNKIFPNKLVSFTERQNNYTVNGNKMENIPTLIIQLEDAPGVSNLDIAAAASETPVFTVLDPNNGNAEICVLDRYTVFGSCDRSLETGGFKTILSMYTEDIVELHNKNISDGTETPAASF